MSASQKKKAARDERMANMTERQRQEAQEAKKLKAYTASFWIILALCVCIVLSTVVSNPIKNVIYKNTSALTVGEHTLTSVDLNYYYIDAINEYYNTYSYYVSLMGLDVTKPLDEQIYNAEAGETWADAFIDMATESIRQTYALYDKAMAEGYKLTEDESKSIDSQLSTLSVYAMYYGYSNVDTYLRAVYGNGSTEESYRNYLEVNTVADSYYNNYYDSLEYTDSDLRDYESQEDRYHNFSSVTYATYYLDYTKWAPSKGADGNAIEYTEEQLNDARAEAKKAAELLAGMEYEDIAALNEAIKTLPINEGATTGITATENNDLLCSNVSIEAVKEWLLAEGRYEGEMGVIPYTTGEGENEVLNGYYVVRFGNLNENTFALKNVRHLLVKFTGGTTNSTTGTTTYSDAEKQAAKAEAEKLYEQWKNGLANEESFIELANKESDDGDGTTGGLYEDIYPGQMVSAFEDWCYDEARQAGDTGIIETEYGYHIMYFVGDSETTYRDLMLESTMKNEAVTEWANALTETVVATLISDKNVNKGLVLSAS